VLLLAPWCLWVFFVCLMKIYEVGNEDEEQERDEDEEKEKCLLDDGSPLHLLDMQILPLHF
jgi:hypothetical protein